MLTTSNGRASSARKSYNILLVEDDADVADSLAETLTEVGHVVTIARDGRVAFDRLVGDRAPDLVLLDLKLPEHSGQDVLAMIRQSPTLGNVPVVVVSATVNAQPLGATAWTRKPVEPAELLALVERHARSKDAAPVSAPLRYRFETQEQLLAHLHMIDGRALLFYRDDKLSLQTGARVLLEITIGATGQRSVMRGQVLGFEQSRTEGVWLEFADARLPRRAGDAALVARLQRRIATDLVVGLRGPSGFQMCRLVDVSMTGARLAGASSSLMVGAEVELRFSSLPLASSNESGICRARVVRFEGGEAGLRFSRGDAPTRQLVTKLFSALQEYWARVPEVIHPPICCGPGGPLDPPLPRLARRA